MAQSKYYTKEALEKHARFNKQISKSIAAKYGSGSHLNVFFEQYILRGKKRFMTPWRQNPFQRIILIGNEKIVFVFKRENLEKILDSHHGSTYSNQIGFSLPAEQVKQLCDFWYENHLSIEDI